MNHNQYINNWSTSVPTIPDSQLSGTTPRFPSSSSLQPQQQLQEKQSQQSINQIPFSPSSEMVPISSPSPGLPLGPNTNNTSSSTDNTTRPTTYSTSSTVRSFGSGINSLTSPPPPPPPPQRFHHTTSLSLQSPFSIRLPEKYHGGISPLLGLSLTSSGLASTHNNSNNNSNNNTAVTTDSTGNCFNNNVHNNYSIMAGLVPTVNTATNVKNPNNNVNNNNTSNSSTNTGSTSCTFPSNTPPPPSSSSASASSSSSSSSVSLSSYSNSLATSPPMAPLGVSSVTLPFANSSNHLKSHNHTQSQSHSSLFMPQGSLNEFNNINGMNSLQFSNSFSNNAFNAFNPTRSPMQILPSSTSPPLPPACSSSLFSYDVNGQDSSSSPHPPAAAAAPSSVMDQNINNSNSTLLNSTMIPSSSFNLPLDNGILEATTFSKLSSSSQQATPVASDFGLMGSQNQNQNQSQDQAQNYQHPRTHLFLHAETDNDQFPILVCRNDMPPLKQPYSQFQSQSRPQFQNQNQNQFEPVSGYNFDSSQQQQQQQQQQQHQQVAFSSFQNHKKHQSFSSFPNVSFLPPSSNSSDSNFLSPSSSIFPSNLNSNSILNLKQQRPTPIQYNSDASDFSRQRRHSQSFLIPHSSCTQKHQRPVSSYEMSSNLTDRGGDGNSFTSSSCSAYSTLPSHMETLDSVHNPSVQHQQQQLQQLQTQKSQPVFNPTHSSSNSLSPLSSLQSPLSPTSISASNFTFSRRNYNNPTAASSSHHHRYGSKISTKYADATIEQFESKIYTLCKDQHGCRFLQKTLDEEGPNQNQQHSKYFELIFRETAPHMGELMTDPFGNYLCQKLLQHSTTQQRTQLVRNSAGNLVNIALDMHGTRALQKMIEYAAKDSDRNSDGNFIKDSGQNSDQVDIIVEALRSDVICLIKDLNGNHVIQKCLTHFHALDTQFIIDAVCENCVEVATHKHGCCVLQRCIDHASTLQRQQLILKIVEHSHELVQDPFGNYVVQYVLDLKEEEKELTLESEQSMRHPNPSQFLEPLICTFVGHVCKFSQQKFSSNVMEKCIRYASPQTQRMLIKEIIYSKELDVMLCDPYANYVVQTALDYCNGNGIGGGKSTGCGNTNDTNGDAGVDPNAKENEEMKRIVAACLIPILPSIKMTPWGRKIQAKLQQLGSTTSGYENSLPLSLSSSAGTGTDTKVDTRASGIEQFGGSNSFNMSIQGQQSQRSSQNQQSQQYSQTIAMIQAQQSQQNHQDQRPMMNSAASNMSMGMNQMNPNQMSVNHMTSNQMNQLTQMINSMGVSQHSVNTIYDKANPKNEVITNMNMNMNANTNTNINKQQQQQKNRNGRRNGRTHHNSNSNYNTTNTSNNNNYCDNNGYYNSGNNSNGISDSTTFLNTHNYSSSNNYSTFNNSERNFNNVDNIMDGSCTATKVRQEYDTLSNNYHVQQQQQQQQQMFTDHDQLVPSHLLRYSYNDAFNSNRTPSATSTTNNTNFNTSINTNGGLNSFRNKPTHQYRKSYAGSGQPFSFDALNNF